MTHQMLRLVVISLFALVAARAPAQDSSPAELRREIEQLRAENDLLASHNQQLAAENEQLKAEAETLRGQIEALNTARATTDRQISDLKAQLAARPGPEATTGPDTPPADPAAPLDRGPRAPVPEEPLASPESLYSAVRRAYVAQFPNPDLGTDEKDAAYKDRITKWAQDVTRSMRGPTKWRVRLTDIVQKTSPRGATARMAVLDPVTGLQIGESFLVDVPSRMALKLTAEPVQYYDLTLVLSPAPQVNPARRTRGVFEWPRFIGPMVDFAFEFEWDGLRPVQAAADAPETEQTPGSPARP